MRNNTLKIAIKAVILPMLGATLMADCATFHQAHEKQVQTERAITRYQPPKAPPVVSTVDTPFLLGTVVDVRHAVPAILKQSITLIYTYPMTLRQIAGKITQKKGIPVHIEDSQESSTSAAPGGMLPPLPSQTGGFPNPLQGTGSQSGYTSRGIPLDWHG
ncbi:MAG: hypothetical protein B7Z70_11190, partial [Acidithiobacillus ferrivorans]